MQYPIAETIDVCMQKLFAFVKNQYTLPMDPLSSVMVPVENRRLTPDQLYQMLLKAFESYVLPTHKTVHVQFIMFYLCSFKVCLPIFSLASTTFIYVHSTLLTTVSHFPLFPSYH